MQQTFQDCRIVEAAKLLEHGDFKLLSLDVFDTLIFRTVPAPIDVFLQIGTLLKQRGLLGAGQTAESFAALRYQIEYEARGRRQRDKGDREINLHDIYDLFPSQCVKTTNQQLCEIEIEAECKVAFANEEMFALARRAKERGLKLALISNMYLGREAVERILRGCCADLPAFDAFLVSSDHRMGKRTGLMQKMAQNLEVEPHEILHIGDNPVSDKLAALEAGFHFIDYGHSDGFYASLSSEHPRQWFERAAHYATPAGDAGMTALRCHCATLPRPAQHPEHYLYGLRQMGPLIAGFTAWAGARIKQEKAKNVFGLVREGDTLGQIMQILHPDLIATPMATSRLSAALAGFTPDYPEHLEDFLTRRGFWSLEMLMGQLGFTRQETERLDNPDLTLADIPAPELTRRILASPLAGKLFETSAVRRQRLMRYMHNIGALACERLYLLDLGYAATIQRAIQRVFTIEKKNIVTHGLYLASAHVSRITQLAGGIVEGFLAQNGNPNDFACAFCRSPEIVELSLMPDYGTVTGYDDQAHAVFAENDIPQSQKQQVAVLQAGLFDFARMFAVNCSNLQCKPDFTDPSWALQMRALALRLVAYPTFEEAQLMGDWVADSDMGLASPRAIVSAGAYESRLARLTPQELAALPRRDVPWLYGVAAARGPDYVQAVARIIMRYV